MLPSLFFSACILLSTVSVSALTLAEMGIAPDGHSRLRNEDGTIHRVKFTPPPKPMGLAAISSRQTTREQIMARRLRRPMWKKAYSSMLACGGYAGQTFQLQATAAGQTSYVQSSYDPRIGGEKADAITLTMNSDCNLLTTDGRFADAMQYQTSSIYFDTQEDIDDYHYQKLVCIGQPDSYELSCTINGGGTLCTDTDGRGAFYIADSCMNLVVLTITPVDP